MKNKEELDENNIKVIRYREFTKEEMIKLSKKL